MIAFGDTTEAEVKVLETSKGTSIVARIASRRPSTAIQLCVGHVGLR